MNQNREPIGSVGCRNATDALVVRLGKLAAIATVMALAFVGRAGGQLVDHVFQVSIDGLHAGHLLTLLQSEPETFPNFQRFVMEGVSTFNARTDFFSPFTLPNHTSMMTGRPVTQPGDDPTLHHGHINNTTPGPARTLHTGNPAVDYIASVFDLAHDHGFSTALYATKDKFVLYEQTYNATEFTPGGRPDAVLTNGDQGTDKIDRYVFDVTAGSSEPIMRHLRNDLAETKYNYTFLHLFDPDSAGHAAGWGSPVYERALQTIDLRLGALFEIVENDATLRGNTAIIVTSDHGGSLFDHNDTRDLDTYQVPFFVWGPNVPADVDLYSLNLLTRLDPGVEQVPFTEPNQPIRNSDSANLALSLLGVPAIDGSSINAFQDLRVELPVLSTWDGNRNDRGQPGDAVSWGDARNWTRHASDQLPIAGDIVRLPANDALSVIEMQRDRNLHALQVQGEYALSGGTVNLLTGQLEIAGTGSLRIDGALHTPRSIIKTGAGTLKVSSVTGETQLIGGRIEGNARFTADFANASVLAPGEPGENDGFGSVTVTRTYTQSGIGTLEMQLGDAGLSDQLIVRGLTIYRGGLHLLADEQVLPDETRELQTWQLTETNSKSGRFARLFMNDRQFQFMRNEAEFQLSHLGDGRFAQLRYAADGLALTMFQTVPGDVNGDGSFDTQDLVSVFAIGGYENGVGADASWLSGDWNGDQDFTSSDLVTALAISGFEQRSFLPTDSPAVVPEPTSHYTILIGVVSVLRWFPSKRRRRG